MRLGADGDFPEEGLFSSPVAPDSGIRISMLFLIARGVMADPARDADWNARVVGARHGYGRLRGAGRSIVRSAVAVLHLVLPFCLRPPPGARQPAEPTHV